MQEEECDEHNNQNNKIQNRKQPQKTRSIKKSLNQNHYMLNPNIICNAVTSKQRHGDIYHTFTIPHAYVCNKIFHRNTNKCINKT